MTAHVRPVHSSVEAMLADATARTPFATGHTRSGSPFEAVTIGGERFVVKHLHLDDDFALRAGGDLACRPVRAFAAGLYDVAADRIDSAVVAAAAGTGRNGWGGALLMRDVSGELTAPGDGPFSEKEHHRFVRSLAALCLATWGWEDEWELLPYANRWRLFDHHTLDAERALGWPEFVPRLACDGWEQFDQRAPRDVARAVDELRRDVEPLVGALRATPSCFLHGDWKAPNLGTAADGRTLLLDWTQVGMGPPCHELAWYLALNRSKLPPGTTKEQVMDEFRAALTIGGIDTEPWWGRQLPVCLLGTVLQFGWEKALGDDDELGWWCERAREGLALL